MTKFERIARESTIPTSILAIALLFCGCSKTPGDLVAEGNRQLQSRQYTDAALTFRKAIQIEPNNGKAHFGLAKVLAQGQNTSELYRELSEAVCEPGGPTRPPPW